MKELPLFDDGAPIVCTIDAADREGRKDLLHRMRTAVSKVERTSDGLLLRFSPEDDDLFERFSLLEKQCCKFFGFRFQSGRLEWGAPAGASEIMNAIHRFFADPTTSDAELERLLPTEITSH